MGERFYNDNKPAWLRFTQTWGNKPGNGRYHKTRASRLARRAAKRELMGLHPRKGHVGAASECSWRGW